MSGLLTFKHHFSLASHRLQSSFDRQIDTLLGLLYPGRESWRSHDFERELARPVADDVTDFCARQKLELMYRAVVYGNLVFMTAGGLVFARRNGGLEGAKGGTDFERKPWVTKNPADGRMVVVPLGSPGMLAPPAFVPEVRKDFVHIAKALIRNNAMPGLARLETGDDAR